MKKYPEAKFVSTAVKSTGDKTADVTGDLTLHGVTKPVTFKATFNGEGKDPWVVSVLVSTPPPPLT